MVLDSKLIEQIFLTQHQKQNELSVSPVKTKTMDLLIPTLDASKAKGYKLYIYFAEPNYMSADLLHLL